MTFSLMPRAALSLVGVFFAAFVFTLPVAADALTFEPITFSAGSRPYQPNAANLNGDAFLDLVIPNQLSYTVDFRFGTGNGTFSAPVTRAFARQPIRVTFGDLDNDTDTDVIIANSASSSVAVLLNEGNGTFGTETYYSTPGGGGTPQDVNGDGYLDLVYFSYAADSVSVLMNNGNGTFASVASYAVGDGPWTGPYFADLNGDDYPEILTPNDAGHNFSVLMNNGNGTFATTTNYAAATNTDALVIMDFNDDGDLDVAASNYGGRSISIFFGNGDGTFGVPTQYSQPSNLGGSIVGADLDDDGDNDLAAQAYAGGGFPYRIAFLMNNGDGTFAYAPSVEVGNPSLSPFVAHDLDGDGDLDILGGYDNYGLFVLTNDGNATFTTSTFTAAGGANFANGISADLDSDGDLDALTGMFTGSSVFVWLNDAYEPQPSLSTMNPSSAMAGSSGFTMTITGSGFVTSSQVYFNGSSRSTTVVSPTQVTASILTGDLATAGSYSVEVRNASFIGGGPSNSDTFTVHAASGGAGSGGGGLSSSGSGGSSALPPLTTTFQTNLQNLQNQGVSVHGLIKIPSNSAVYYVGSDGKRHAFPNDKVYFTWYESFDGIQLVNEAQMSSIPLGKNVTYKPGKKMVKFTTDNKVYAVAKGGILRWITTEEAAIALYGSSWNTNIDDISDAFYTNYTFGNNVSGLSDFNPTTVQASVMQPSDSLEM